MSLRRVNGWCPPWLFGVGVLSNPGRWRLRRRGLIVRRQAAVMATPGSTSVQIIAVVPVSVASLRRGLTGAKRDERLTKNIRVVG